MDHDAPHLSVVVIAQDEESNLGRCLSSVVSVADEIVVIDGESHDDTRTVARQFTERVIVNPFSGHIEQKNFGLAQARGRWVLSLDADESLSPKLQDSLTHAFPDLCRGHDGFSVSRKSLFLGQWMRYGGWYPDRKIRLAKRELATWGGTNPHDQLLLPPSSRIGRLVGDLLHFTSPDLRTHLRKQRSHSHVMAAERFRRGGTVSSAEFWLHPVVAFLRTYLLLQGFRDGRHGLLLAVCAAFYRLQVAARLWEMTLRSDGTEIADSGAAGEVECDT